jgi:hypothetical protein
MLQVWSHLGPEEAAKNKKGAAHPNFVDVVTTVFQHLV